MSASNVFQEFRVRSFYLNGRRVCDSLVLYFKLSESGWMSLTIGEGVAILSGGVPISEIQISSDLDEDPAYPVMMLEDLDRYIGRKLFRVFEYRIKNIDEGCVGVFFDCGDGGFSVLEEDACLSFCDGLLDLSSDTLMVELDAWPAL